MKQKQIADRRAIAMEEPRGMSSIFWTAGSCGIVDPKM